jgi:hypothetical protein
MQDKPVVAQRQQDAGHTAYAGRDQAVLFVDIYDIGNRLRSVFVPKTGTEILSIGTVRRDTVGTEASVSSWPAEVVLKGGVLGMAISCGAILMPDLEKVVGVPKICEREERKAILREYRSVFCSS